MEIRRFLFVLIVALALLVPVFTSQTRAAVPPPPQLVNVLAQLKRLDDDSFLKVAIWARAGADTVYSPTFDYEHDEVLINILDHDMRYAVLQWLRGNGRHDLYNLRVTDDQIGQQRSGADSPPPSTPTPDVWRPLSYASATMNSSADTSAIEVSKRIGAARIDGTEIAFCIAFKNNSPKTATLLHYEMALSDAAGHALGSVPFELKGKFSTGIFIDTSVSSYRDMDSNGYGYNCSGVKTPQATLPVLGARYYTPQLTVVKYEDGTSWMATEPAVSKRDVPADAMAPPAMLPGSRQGPLQGDMGITWLSLPIAATYNAASQIELTSGFGIVPEQGNNLNICFSFRNNATTAVREIDFTFSAVGGDGSSLGELSYVRKGSFSTGTLNQSFTLDDLLAPIHSLNHNLYDNCVLNRKTPRYNPAWRWINYQVTRVLYEDGTTWSAAPPTP